MENITETKYTLAKYSNPKINKIIIGSFKNYEEMFKVFGIDNNYYFILKEEVRDSNSPSGWKTLVDRTFALKEEVGHDG